jgi:hypothetical protein
VVALIFLFKHVPLTGQCSAVVLAQLFGNVRRKQVMRGASFDI